MLSKSHAQKEFSLEDHLILSQAIAFALGLENLGDIREFSEDSEGYEDDGRTRMHYLILRKLARRKIPESLLQKYDDNIKKYSEYMKKNRRQELTLKYYQYLAVLFAEIYLDNYFKDPKRFPVLINQWNKERGSTESIGRKQLSQKIAYWMATGSGKTLIMHINYWQFQEYNKGPNKIDYDNIILVTSDDKMSEQHKQELLRSGIPAELFDGTSSGCFPPTKDKVKIISIHKLKLPEEKSGEGVTVDISRFGTKNLVFIDEGHKGQKSEDAKWKKVREKLAEDGFIWEYSATFGQTITSEKSPYFSEYKYSILFDYSYKYFHQDGYGKDFHILNLNTSKFKDQDIPILLLANALDYYEQLQIFYDTPNLREYEIEKPLWIFVGSKVSTENSDILQVVRFLDNLLQDDKSSIVNVIKRIIVDGESRISGLGNKDAFAHHYPEKDFVYLREQINKNVTTPEKICQGMFSLVFHIPNFNMGQKLELYDLKNSEGEIGLRASGSYNYFGVINIGNKSSFLKLVREKIPTVNIRDESFQGSLFDTIDKKTATINLLLGAKKFIEGWNSYRVSNMCLFNIGKNEGPQIIQLFGRGVRLKGQKLADGSYSLKRSCCLPGLHPQYIRALETLKIFGIQANYLQTFKEYIEKEMPIYDLQVPTSPLLPFPENLQTIYVEKDWDFKNTLFEFVPQDPIEFTTINLLPKTTDIDSRGLMPTGQEKEPNESIIAQEVIDILDWDEIYYEILEYKRTRGINNIHIGKDSLKQVIEDKKYQLFCNEEDINPQKFIDMERVQEVVLTILKKRIDQYYRKKRLEEEAKHYLAQPLTNEDERIRVTYNAKIKAKDENTVKIIEEQALSIKEKGYQSRLSGDYLIKIYFPNHLYQPLLSEPTKEELVITPAGLNSGETQFVNDLQKYLANKTLGNKQVYLLRNLTRGKGIGFFEENRFFPDFILWLKSPQDQRIVFIDPKGISRFSLDNPKLTLHIYLKETIQPKIPSDILLDAYIVSVTPYDAFLRTLPRKKNMDQLVSENHLLFMKETVQRNNEKYVDDLFTNILAR